MTSEPNHYIRSKRRAVKQRAIVGGKINESPPPLVREVGVGVRAAAGSPAGGERFGGASLKLNFFSAPARMMSPRGADCFSRTRHRRAGRRTKSVVNKIRSLKARFGAFATIRCRFAILLDRVAQRATGP